MNPYLCPPEQPERDFIAALKARGFKKLTAEDGKRKYDSTILPRSVLIKGDVWVGYIEDRAFIFEWGRGWQPFDVVLAEIDRRDDAADGRPGRDGQPMKVPTLIERARALLDTDTVQVPSVLELAAFAVAFAEAWSLFDVPCTCGADSRNAILAALAETLGLKVERP